MFIYSGCRIRPLGGPSGSCCPRSRPKCSRLRWRSSPRRSELVRANGSCWCWIEPAGTPAKNWWCPKVFICSRFSPYSPELQRMSNACGCSATRGGQSGVPHPRRLAGSSGAPVCCIAEPSRANPLLHPLPLVASGSFKTEVIHRS